MKQPDMIACQKFTEKTENGSESSNMRKLKNIRAYKKIVSDPSYHTQLRPEIALNKQKQERSQEETWRKGEKV